MSCQPNIVFIVIDALRARNLGCYGYSRQTSPNLDSMAKDSVLFENAFSCAVKTDPSLTSIFSGKHPRSHGIITHGGGLRKEYIARFNKSGISLLPEILKSKGYVTLAVDWLGRWHKRGYDYYSGISGQREHARIIHRLMIESASKFKPLYLLIDKVWKPANFIEDARIVTRKAIELLSKAKSEKFFLFIHYWDTHLPYNAPTYYLKKFINCGYENNLTMREILSQIDPKHVARLRARISSSVKSKDKKRLDDVATVNEILARYDGAIAHVDNEIGKLINALKEYEILEQTFILLTADHGESLTEHQIFFSHHGLYDETIRVPLILRIPGLPKNKRIKGLVQHTDIVPTILDVLNQSIDMRKSSTEFDGKSVIPLIYDNISQLHSAIYVEEADTERKGALRTTKHKYICASSEKDAICSFCGRVHGGVEELYDLEKDPEEILNLFKEQKHRASVLRRRLHEWVKLLEQRKRSGKESLDKPYMMYGEEEEKKEIMERLRKLGYL